MMDSSVPPEICRAAESLLAQSGRGSLQTIRPLAGGRNNRVYRVESISEAAILKHYFRSPGAGHDRFAAEIAWYRYCEERRIPQVPQLWGFDAATSCALFAEIPGRKLIAGEVTADHVTQAAAFFTHVNAHRQTASAAKLPVSADACFTLDEYVSGVERRLARLTGIPANDGPSQALEGWLTGPLRPVWSEVRAGVEAAYPPTGRIVVLPVEQRCLSPSDFGFHNAILDAHRRLWFLDFEYAGWDDPAKTVCDFYWQVDVPAPRETMPILLDAVRPFGTDVAQRVQALFPLFGIKWATIVLNESLQDSQIRRHFAAGGQASKDHRLRQLAVAQRLVADVQIILDSNRER